jgi:hypothetical protein
MDASILLVVDRPAVRASFLETDTPSLISATYALFDMPAICASP